MDVLEAKKIWSEVKSELKTVLPEHAYIPWINGLDVSGCEDDRFHLISVHQMAPQIIKQNYYKKIVEAFKKISGKDFDFSVVYDADYAKKYEEAKRKSRVKSNKEDNTKNDALENLAQMHSSANLNLKYKFDNFVVGENSRFTYSVAQHVAKNPAQKYNPLFIYGAPGLGKTHIMQAIGHYIIFNKKGLKVKYIKTEEYVNELIKSIQKSADLNRKMETFRQKYRNVDVLLIDDIQFIESKQRTMDEIFHTFDYLLNKNKQIVITSDRLPSEIPGLPARLQSRFEMGIVTEITPPDFETRAAIVKNLAEQDGIELKFEVCEYISSNFVNNVRELEGAYNKVSAYAAFYNSELTLDLAKKVLKCDEKKRQISVAMVASAVADYYGVSVDDFISSARAQKISAARQIAVYLSRELTGESFEQIAKFYNKKHPTMLYSYDKVKKDLKNNRSMNTDIEYIIKKVKE